MLTRPPTKVSIVVISLTLAATAHLWAERAVAHQFEDGYIERTVAVRIRDREVRIEYSIGLNDATMEKFRKAWPDDQALRDQFQAVQTDKPNPSAPEPDASADDQINLPEEGSLVNEIQLIRAFAKSAAPKLRTGLRVLVNEKRIDLKLVSAEPSPKHHATLETVWTFQLPPDAMLEMSVQDTNLLRQSGGIKYSLKTSGSCMTLQSNVAPILIRSKRIGLDSVGARQRLLVPGISARVRVLKELDAKEHPPTENPTTQNSRSHKRVN